MSDLDFSRMTLHQAKRGEMESQVRVLELESELEKERQRLSELRRQHYKMAAESEDVDAEVSDVTTSHERSFIVLLLSRCLQNILYSLLMFDFIR